MNTVMTAPGFPAPPGSPSPPPFPSSLDYVYNTLLPMVGGIFGGIALLLLLTLYGKPLSAPAMRRLLRKDE